MAVTEYRVESPRLPCGRRVEELWAELYIEQRSEHEQSCAHCITARAALTRLAAATKLLRRQSLAPPPALVEQIMVAVRADVRRSRKLPLPTTAGPAHVAEQAVAIVLRAAADTVPGVRAHSCRIAPGEHPGTVRVWMTLSMRYRSGPATDLAAQVRTRVQTAIFAQIGLTATTLDLSVVDVWHPHQQGRPPETTGTAPDH